MNDKPLSKDPSNRVVTVFDSLSEAEAAIAELSKLECTDAAAKLYRGEEAADNIDTSAKWFADTDVELRRYEKELRTGSIVVSVPISSAECRDEVHAVFKRHNARLITHFGEWVTEMMR